MTVSAAVVSLAGRYRRHAALVFTAVMLARVPFDFGAVYATIAQEGLVAAIHPGYLRAGAFVVCVPLAVAAIHLARRFREHPFGRRPVLLQHVSLFRLAWTRGIARVAGIPAGPAMEHYSDLPAFFWFLAYALMEQRSRTPVPLLFQVASFYPVPGFDESRHGARAPTIGEESTRRARKISPLRRSRR